MYSCMVICTYLVYNPDNVLHVGLIRFGFRSFHENHDLGYLS